MTVAATGPLDPELTDRQLEVAHLIDQGMTYAEIGVELGISARTAKAHALAIRSKYGISKKRLISPELRDRGVL
jgi:Response regulator containing a CheY-like receiver domain and an HTH DNA-binding domain